MAMAWASFDLTSGLSISTRVSPLCTMSPSDAKNCSILPGTLPDTLYSVASACPCITTGFGFDTA